MTLRGFTLKILGADGVWREVDTVHSFVREDRTDEAWRGAPKTITLDPSEYKVTDGRHRKA